jgi:nitrite reductase/ring-hydroxylating ferredoxin subunit
MLGKYILLFCLSVQTLSAYVTTSLAPFNEWHCIDFMKNIDMSKPHVYNIGALPLVSWFDEKNNPMTTVNVCKHLGSKLDHGKVKDGCLTCPYHGLEHDVKDTFGKSIIFQDKLWWSYEPKTKNPPAIPYYNKKMFATSEIKIDIDANLIDCVYNAMDLNHPAFVHNNAFGFGSNIPPSNIKTIKYKNIDKLGLTFVYKSNSNLIHFKRELRKSHNFHIYEYPYFTWSRVSLPTNEQLFVNVNMLPLAENKTRWLVTLKHNFWTTSVEKYFMKFAALCILLQDKMQLSKQANVDELKKIIMHQTIFDNEEHIMDIKNIVEKYKYPDHNSVLQLYKYDKYISKYRDSSS